MEASRRAKAEKNTWSVVKSEGFAHYPRLQWRGALWIRPQGRTVSKEYYLEVISRLREAIRQKHIELC